MPPAGPPRLTSAAAHPLLGLLLAATFLLAAAADSANAASATVVRVVDGDTVRVREAGRARTVDLLGVDAPEAGACHAAEATQALKKLLPAKARVRTTRDPRGAKTGRYLFRGGKLINAALLRSGDARATGADTLARGGALSAAQRAAEGAKRGLWKCAAGQPQAEPQTGTGEAAKERARADIAGRAFIRITSTTFSSSESRLNFCPDGSFVEYVETYSDFGGSTYGTYRGRWEVLSAEYGLSGDASANVRRLNEDGSVGFVEIVSRGGQVTVNGNAVSVQQSNACG